MRMQKGTSLLAVSMGLMLTLTGCAPNKYTVQIQRTFHNTLEEKLLQTAESTYPSRSDVIAAAEQDASELPDDFLWWYKDVGDVHWPYAITSETVFYYSGIIASRQLAESGFQFSFGANSESLVY